MSIRLTKDDENVSNVILNLFQDLRRCRFRRSRNKFGMTGMMVRDDRFEGIFE